VTVRDKYREGHDLIIKGLGRARTVCVNGKYTKLRYVNLWPRADPAAASPCGFPASARSKPGLVRRPQLQLQLSVLQRLQARAGRCSKAISSAAPRAAPTQPYSAAFFQQVCISDTDAACERSGGRTSTTFSNKCLHLYRLHGRAGLHERGLDAAAVVAQVGQRHINMGMNKTWKELVEQRYIVAGSPATRAPAARRTGGFVARRTPAVRPHLGSARSSW